MMMLSQKLFTVLIILIVGVFTSASADVRQSITAPLSVGYESNPQFSRSNQQSISRITLSPSYSLNTVQGADKWSANANLNIIRTSKQSISQDRNDPSVNLGWSHDYETGQFSVKGLFNTQSTQVSELTDSGLIEGDNTRNNRSVSVNWINNLSERTSLTLGSKTTDVSFSGLTTSGLVDYLNESLSSSLNYVISEKLQTSISLSNSRYSPKNASNTDSETNSANIGMTWNTAEKLNISASIGSNETQRGNSPKNGSWKASLTSQYTTSRTNTSFNLSRRQSPSSLGSVNESNQLSVNWSYSLSERDNIAIALSSVKNLTINSTKTSQYSASYTKELSLSWDFRLNAKHIARDNRLTNVSSNSIMATIIYKLPDF